MIKIDKNYRFVNIFLEEKILKQEMCIRDSFSTVSVKEKATFLLHTWTTRSSEFTHTSHAFATLFKELR